MTVLVTGGAGFLGAAVVRRLAARGDRVVVVDNVPSGLPPGLEALGEAVTPWPADAGDLASLLCAVQRHRVRRIVHAAAIVGVASSIQAPGHVVRVNMETTLAVLEATRLAGVERVVHVSSEESYGPFRYEPADEQHPLDPAAPYGIAKVAAEQLGRFYRSAYGTDFVSIRTSWVYGPGLSRSRVPRTLVEAAVEGRALHLASGADSRIDHTYVEDCVDGILLALDHPVHRHDVYNISSGQAWGTAEMAGIVSEIVPGARLSVGPGPLEYSPGFGVVRKGALDVRRAGDVLGYRARWDLRRGLEAYVDWYRRQRAGSGPGAVRAGG